MLLVGFIGLLFGYWANGALVPGTSPGAADQRSVTGSTRAISRSSACIATVQARRKSASPPAFQASTRCAGCHRTRSLIRAPADPAVDGQSLGDIESPSPGSRFTTLPDFVYFSHKRHVAGGDRVPGPVTGRWRQWTSSPARRPPKMGLCLTCHREHRGRTSALDCLTCHK